ncbi:MAG: ATP-binding protein [Alphaproteobacteria bacterium]
MFFKKRKIIHIEKNSKLVEQILLASLPTVLVLLFLVAFKLISPFIAIFSYATVVIFNLALMFPTALEMQHLRKYIASLSRGENFDAEALKLTDEEAKNIVESVNFMHQFWAQKTNDLEEKTMSDTAVLDSLPDPVLMLNKKGVIIGANLSAKKLVGDDVLERSVDKVFDSHAFIKAISAVLGNKKESQNLVFYTSKPIEQKLYAHIKSLPWISTNMAVCVVSLYDLTKVVRLEKMQADFVANASHELRTPLSVISGFIETLQTSAKDDKNAQKEFLKIMKEQAEYMSALIENLLSLSKIEMNQHVVPNEKVDVKKIVQDVSSALRLKAENREIKLITNIDENVKPIIGNPSQIAQIVQNLIDNAVKYGFGQSDILIHVYKVEEMPKSQAFNSQDGEALAIAINNKGPKISNENIVRLTERFYRMQEHKDLNIKGTGLGLSIAKQIILHHRGNLTVNSTSYNGTTFTIYLPLKLI